MTNLAHLSYFLFIVSQCLEVKSKDEFSSKFWIPKKYELQNSSPTNEGEYFEIPKFILKYSTYVSTYNLEKLIFSQMFTEHKTNKMLTHVPTTLSKQISVIIRTKRQDKNLYR